MATFNGDTILVPVTIAEGAVSLAGEGITTPAVVNEGAIRLAGEAMTASFASIFPFVPATVTTATETWSGASVTPQAEPSLSTASETWLASVTTPQVAPSVTASGESWATSNVTVPSGAVTPNVPPSVESWATNPLTVVITPTKQPAQVFAAGSASAYYVDIESLPPQTLTRKVVVTLPLRERPKPTFEYRNARMTLAAGEPEEVVTKTSAWLAFAAGLGLGVGIGCLLARGRR